MALKNGLNIDYLFLRNNMKIINNKIFLFSLRFFVGLVFIIAGIIKIIAPVEFFEAVMNYKIFGEFISQIIAVVIPWLELIIGLLIIFEVYIKENLLLYLVLLLSFNILIASAIIRGLNINCGCFGTENSMQVGFYKLAENFGLFFIALFLFLKYYKHND